MCVYSSVQDKTIGTSIPVLDLIDAIQPESVNFELVKTGSLADEDKLDNAKYPPTYFLCFSVCSFMVGFVLYLNSERTAGHLQNRNNYIL